MKLDGIKGEIYGTLFEPSTEYSKEYSPEKFLNIKTGMTENEVINILGQPLDRFNPYPSFNDTLIYRGLRYSKGKFSNSNYRLRIIFLKNGIVTERRSKFFFND